MADSLGLAHKAWTLNRPTASIIANIDLQVKNQSLNFGQKIGHLDYVPSLRAASVLLAAWQSLFEERLLREERSQ
jgi:hypothetical protein